MITMVRALMAVLMVGVLALVAAGPASAYSGYSTYPGSTWNVRSCAGTCDVVGKVSGTLPDLVCQDVGPTVSVTGFGASPIYDLVRLPGTNTLGYMSDLGVQQTKGGVFTPGLPRCTAASSYVSGSIQNQGYSWAAQCAAKALFGKSKGACWTTGAKYLFTPTGTAG